MNTTCSSTPKSDITLIFKSSVEGQKKCIVSFKPPVTCKNFTYGMIDNYPKKNYSSVYLQVLIILLMDLLHAKGKKLLYQK